MIIIIKGDLKMIRRTKKAFTIVELVIVIAVIAVLTAILVPTFISISNKADKASDQSLVKNLNTALKIVENDPTMDPNGKNVTMHDAVEDLAAYGYDLSKLVTKSDEKMVWNSTDNQFYFEQGQNSLAYWKIANTVAEAESETKYSVYANRSNAWAGAYLNVKTNFDAGYNDSIAQVNLTSDAAETYLVRTNGGILTVDAPNATIKHYSSVDVVIVEHVDRNASYHEFGRVEVSLDMKDGHAVVEEDGYINELNVPQTTAGNSVSVDVKAGGEVASAIVDDASATVVVASGAEIGQFVGDTTNVSGAGAQEVKENAITKTEVDTEAKLRKAIDTDHDKYIVFTADITASAVYLLTTDVNIDGNGHKITSSANRIFRVAGSNIEIVFQNLDMISTFSGSDSRGISIDSNYENIDLSIVDCSMDVKYYAINITGSNGSGSKNINLKVISSTVKGWAAINNHASLSNIIVNDSTLIGYNQFSAGNNYSTIVFDGSNYEAEGSTSYGSKIVVKNSTLRQITSNATNKQVPFNSQYGNVNSEAYFDNITVEFEGGATTAFCYAYPKTNNVKIFIDGVLYYEGSNY